MRLVLFDHQTVAKAALDMRERHGTAIKAHGQAMVLLAQLTKPAVAAGARGRDCNALAWLEIFDLTAHLVHHTRDFMAQGHGLFDADHTKTAVLVVMQIRTTNAAEGDPNAQLSRKDLAGVVSRVRVQVLQAQVKRAVAHQGTDSSGLFK